MSDVLYDDRRKEKVPYSVVKKYIQSSSPSNSSWILALVEEKTETTKLILRYVAASLCSTVRPRACGEGTRGREVPYFHWKSTTLTVSSFSVMD
jgi:hypothetical protein